MDPPGDRSREDAPGDLVVQGIGDPQGALPDRPDVRCDGGLELLAQRPVQGTGADGPGITKERLEVFALHHQEEVALAGGVIVVEAEVPALEPREGAASVV